MPFSNSVVDTEMEEAEVANLALLGATSEDNVNDASEDVCGAEVSRNVTGAAANPASKSANPVVVNPAANTARVQAPASKISAGTAAGRYKIKYNTFEYVPMRGSTKNTAPVAATTYRIIQGGAYSNDAIGTVRWIVDEASSKMSRTAATIGSGVAASRAAFKAATSKEAASRIAAGIDAGKDAVGTAAVRAKEVTKKAVGGVSTAAALTGAATAGVVLPTLSYIAAGGTAAATAAASVVPATAAVAGGSALASITAAGSSALAGITAAGSSAIAGITASGALAFAGGATATFVAAPVVLPALGFGAGGVISGSIAAGVQSMIGNVAAGSVFAAMQSAGATGLALSTKVLLGLAGGTISGTGVAGVAAAVLL